LPDFSWYNIPKRVKSTQTGENVPKGYKICQMAGKFTKCPQNIGTNIFYCKTLQNLPKWGGVWFEKKPSGNPVLLFCWHIKQTKNKKNKIPIGKGTEDHIGQGS
jgi:hypothetical protein